MGKTLSYIKKAKNVYGDRFDYSKTIYINARTKIIIICRLHGEYSQLPLNHLRQNCPTCNSIKLSKERTNTFEKFKKHLSPFHLDKYNYSKLTSFGFKDKGTIVCPIHGDFVQNLKNHIGSKGCPKCGRQSAIKKVSMTKNQLIDRLTKIDLHKNIDFEIPDKLYTYPSIISCKCKLHGNFNKKVSDLLRGINCTKCKFKGYSRSQFIDFCKRKDRSVAYLYLIRIFNSTEVFYKIGITSTSVKNRFRKLQFYTGYKYEIISLICGSPRKIWGEENKKKKQFALYSYQPKIYFSGYTECFNNKILEYDFRTNEKLA